MQIKIILLICGIITVICENFKSNMKKKQNFENKKEIQPFTIWDELASSDVLIEYLRKFDDSIINTDVELKKRILFALYSYSNEIIPEVEQYFSEKFHNSLTIFLDRVEKWKNQKQ